MIEIERLENSQYNYYAEVDGKIYTKNKRTGEITEKSSRINKDGYLDLNASGKTRLLHRLIAEVFIPCDSDIKGLVVNHKDGNKLNNLPSNLEWCTNKYNTQHYYKELYESLEEVVIINKISKEVLSVFKIQSNAVRQYGVWVNESVKGNSTYGNLIAVKKSEFEDLIIDELIKKRISKRGFHARLKSKRYDKQFVYELVCKFKLWEGGFIDFCKRNKLCNAVARKMIEGRYFTEPSRRSRVKCSVNYYSGLTRITEKYNSKILPCQF